MRDAPEVDGRDRRAVRDHVESIAPHYVDEWDPDADDLGSALVALFSEMAAGVVERLDDAPEKHQVAFFDELGFDRRPPQPATVAVAFDVAEGARDNVPIDAGTEVVADAADGRPEETFRIASGDGFEATPARLREVYSVEPTTDELFAHRETVDGGDEATLFDGENRQEHVLYVGHDDLLAVSDRSTIEVKFETPAPASVLRDDLVWEYYGERTVDGETVEGWHELSQPSQRAVLSTSMLQAVRGPSSGATAIREEPTALAQRRLGRAVEAARVEDVSEAAVVADDADRSLDRATLQQAIASAREARSGDESDGDPSTNEEGTGDDDGDAVNEVGSSNDEAKERAAEPRDDETQDVETQNVETRAATLMDSSIADAISQGGIADALSGRLTLAPAVPIEASPPTGGADGADGVVSIELVPDGPLVETAVDDVECYWIRCRVPEDRLPTGELDVECRGIALGATPTDLGPDALLANDVPQDVEGEEPITPFGELPRHGDAFYVACEEAFTKKDAKATITFSSSGGRLIAIPEGGQFPPGGVTVDVAEGVDLVDTAVLAEELESFDATVLGGTFESLDEGVLGGTAESVDTIALDELESKREAVLDATDRTLGSGSPSTDGGTNQLAGSSDEPRLSWEYWNGDGWTRLPDLDDETESLREPESVTFTVPSDLHPTTVAGHEGYWIRARLVGGEYVSVEYEEVNGELTRTIGGTPPRFDGVSIRYAYPDGREPSHLYAYNNREFSRKRRDRARSFHPFETLPDDQQAVYLGFDRPLYGGPIQLLFDVAEHEYPTSFSPRVRWEYCVDPDRDEWTRLDGSDESESLTEPGIVSLGFAEETTAFERFGHERHWIRARVRGNRFEPPSAENDELPVDSILESVAELASAMSATVTASAVEGLAEVAGEDHERLEEVTSTDVERLAEVASADLEGLEEADNVAELVPDVADEQLQAQTARPQSADDDERRGSGTFTASDVEVDDGEAGDDCGCATSGSTAGGGVENGGCEHERCREVVDTEPPAGAPTIDRPTLRGIYVNAGRASNVTVVEDEVVGSSDGSPDQSFAVRRPPLVDATVWVDESTTLSEPRRATLVAERPDDVEVVTGGDGTVRECWVRWEAVSDLRESGADDRHYVIDRVEGTISFGDGERGRVPSSGRDNVRVSYRTGGGPDGNVPVGAVGDLVSAIPLVDEVINPVPGSGGAPTETTRAVLERAPKTLRDRDRAVTPADVERIAMDASRRLASVRCIPGMDRAGEHAPGWVTLLILPDDRRRKPTPSIDLKRRVQREVSARAPATLVAEDRLVVRGPSYVAARVEATIVADAVGSLGALEDRIDDELTAYLHPITGGEAGEGWSFGQLPAISDVFALLEGCEGVDHVDSLSLHLAGSRSDVTLTEGDPTPSVSPDALVHSGIHDLVVRLETSSGESTEGV